MNIQNILQRPNWVGVVSDLGKVELAIFLAEIGNVRLFEAEIGIENTGGKQYH